MQTMRLTDLQSLRIADLPEDYRVVGVDGSAPFVRSPTGQIMRIQFDGRLTEATTAARHRLGGQDDEQAQCDVGGVMATTPYTSVMD